MSKIRHGKVHSTFKEFKEYSSMDHKELSGTHRNRDWNGGYQGLGSGGNRETLLKGYKISVIK